MCAGPLGRGSVAGMLQRGSARGATDQGCRARRGTGQRGSARGAAGQRGSARGGTGLEEKPKKLLSRYLSLEPGLLFRAQPRPRAIQTTLCSSHRPERSGAREGCPPSFPAPCSLARPKAPLNSFHANLPPDTDSATGVHATTEQACAGEERQDYLLTTGPFKLDKIRMRKQNSRPGSNTRFTSCVETC